jgi:hypothetical protein
MRSGKAVAKKGAPVVQAITDAHAPRNIFWAEKLPLVGEGGAWRQPHTGSGVVSPRPAFTLIC